MKRRTVAITIVMALFVLFMIWSFGALAANRKPNGEPSAPVSSTPRGNAANTSDTDRDPQEQTDANDGDDPDLPAFAKGKIAEAEYLRLREEFIARLRGWEPGKPFDPTA